MVHPLGRRPWQRPEVPPPDIRAIREDDALILGMYGSGNLGDDLLMSAISGALTAHGLSVRVAARHPENASRVVDLPLAPAPLLRPSFFHDVMRFIAAARNSRCFVLGGGGLLQDTHYFHTVATYALPLALAATLGKRTVVWGVGAGPFRYRWNHRLAKAVARLANVVTVRDEDSRSLLDSPGHRIAVVEDPAWWLASPRAPNHSSPSDVRPQPREVEDTIGFVLRTTPDVGATSMAAAIQEMCSGVRASALLIPFEYSPDNPRDRALSDELATLLQSAGVRADVVSPSDYPNPTVVRAALRRCRVVVSMRFHGVILSLAEGIPVIALNFAPKIEHLMHACGLHDQCFAVSQFGDLRLRECVQRHFSDGAASAARQATGVQSLADTMAGPHALVDAVTDMNYQPTRRMRGAMLLGTALGILAIAAADISIKKCGKLLRRHLQQHGLGSDKGATT